MPEIRVWWVVLSLGSSRLEGLHLTINELCWCDEASGSNDVKGTVQRDGSEGRYNYSTDDRGPV